MAVSDHPDWPRYKEALARVAEASARLLEQDPDTPEHAQAEYEFQEALSAYGEVRSRLGKARA